MDGNQPVPLSEKVAIKIEDDDELQITTEPTTSADLEAITEPHEQNGNDQPPSSMQDSSDSGSGNDATMPDDGINTNQPQNSVQASLDNHDDTEDHEEYGEFAALLTEHNDQINNLRSNGAAEAPEETITDEAELGRLQRAVEDRQIQIASYESLGETDKVTKFEIQLLIAQSELRKFQQALKQNEEPEIKQEDDDFMFLAEDDQMTAPSRAQQQSSYREAGEDISDFTQTNPISGGGRRVSRNSRVTKPRAVRQRRQARGQVPAFNLQAAMSNDIVGDAQRNQGLPGQAIFEGHTRRKDAIARIIQSLPESERGKYTPFSRQ